MCINMPIKASILCQLLQIDADCLKFMTIEMAKIDIFAPRRDLVLILAFQFMHE